MIAEHGYMPVGELCRRLEVSEATARRDLTALADEKKIKRTYGGAISEFDNRYPSFAERRNEARGVKAKLASMALSFIKPGLTCFFDTGTTVYAVAEAFRDRPVTPVTVVTWNIPVGEMLAVIPGVNVFLLAGQLHARQSVLMGETAVKSLQFWRFDTAFLSAEAMDLEGIWNTQGPIVEQQRAVVARSTRAVFCLDGRKLNRKASHFLLPWSRIDTLLTDVPFDQLVGSGIKITEDHYMPIGAAI
jgi:DeoR/GlpR family transcriptional regulator of sugar metabolism